MLFPVNLLNFSEYEIIALLESRRKINNEDKIPFWVKVFFFLFFYKTNSGEERKQNSGILVPWGVWFCVVVQCLLTAERGFVHAWIISGVSVPLGLWKPSLPTINRSAGRMLRLAGGKRSPPQSQDTTGSWPIHAVPGKHMCLFKSRQFHHPSIKIILGTHRMKKDDNYFCFFLLFFSSRKKRDCQQPGKKTKQRGCPDYCNAKSTLKKLDGFFLLWRWKKSCTFWLKPKRLPFPPARKKKRKKFFFCR